MILPMIETAEGEDDETTRSPLSKAEVLVATVE